MLLLFNDLEYGALQVLENIILDLKHILFKVIAWGKKKKGKRTKKKDAVSNSIVTAFQIKDTVW